MSSVNLGALWIGSGLGPVEAACLRSMQAQGHAVALFTDGPVENVPSGVECRDYREITQDRPVVRHRQSNHLALFSDIFRYHMLARTDLVWVDLDLFLLQPLAPENGYLAGWEDAGSINSAALRLPPDSPALQNLLRLCDQPYPVPPFYSLRRRTSLLARRAIGRGRPLSQMKWGTFGPLAVTYFLTRSGEARWAAQPEVYYPIHWSEWRLLVEPAELGRSRFTPNTRAVHFWNNILNREYGRKAPPPGSLAAELFASV